MLTPSAVANAKPQAKPYKLADERGMYLLVKPDGARLWRFDYRRPDTRKRNTLSLGAFADVSLRKARDKRDEARALLADGIDPGVHRVAQKRAGEERAANSFEVVAREWLAVKSPEWMDETAKRVTAWLENNVFPIIGKRPIAELEYNAPELLDVLRRMVKRGAVDSAHRVREHMGAVFRYAIATGRAKHDPVADLRDALPRAEVENFAALTKPDDIAALLRAIDGYQGSPVTRAALLLSPLVFQRPGEVRQAEWEHIDLDAGEWRVPASVQKLKKAQKENPRTPDHIVLLSVQAVAILRELQPLTGRGRYVFPGARDRNRPMSNNTVRGALQRLGYTGEEMTAHGFRHMASTRLNEMSQWNPDAIEAALSHKMPGVRGVYAGRAKFLDERKRMMQVWADYLDTLKVGGNVIALRRGSKGK
ncbi:tyrosine-type recombinase/integrase [Rhodanobacter sp. AS-Z3]|uniref:tyrosine-type recombinase/integrase n=1 Tax=Rhodanobacter sp. AS-Z3 TaxID=3031330 RepID=UPI0024787987|nr:integrase arm-type DNA-binding domain-containing protein [Rhodanobacter sp. AS-Z3]WEN13714.1 tyrosine-type recombinase/integrase [Rhodanobacter sp. AS-Z3]